MAKRVYQVWKGSNKFFFGGRLVFGPDAKSLLVTVLLILIPSVLFCTLVVRHIRHEFNNAGYAILVVAILLAIYVLGLLLVTSARDPGIVPRASHPPEEDFNYESSASVDASGRHTPSLQFPRTKEVHVNGMVVRVKYCDTCMLYRPPRCSHCSICNNCVEKFDHHCPWVGQCIGMRNYRYFFMFVSSATILCIYVFSISALYIKILMNRDQGTVWRAMKESPASVVLMAYCFISLWFVGGLTGFHLYLIGTNQTTYENFRYRADSRLNVYNRGCVNNFIEVFCTAIKPSKNKFRSFVQQEVQRQPTTRTREPEAADEAGVGPRSKIEDDLELGGDLLKISQRRNVDANNDDFDIRSRGSNVGRRDSSDTADLSLDQQNPSVQSDARHSSWGRGSNVGRRDSSDTADLSLDQQNPSVQSDARHSSWGRRSGSWEIAPDVAAMTAAAAQNRSNNNQ
ncbi:hypothetical protein C5167_037047 [Papaver somniferum]|uniref:S-acyltransferase n=1 Tax=Papaver somniferum TaxID=3469 RepID=A0A4Y7I8E4_PAPSO|nr:protein S-acyltransferase 8-like isoform X1 [Papaver somniferum]RZC44100.1 hypothetical protein C5167_037047 [Papaver somniferum]